jgi:hypothetical protein
MKRGRRACERVTPECEGAAIRGERFCPVCRDEMLLRMERDRYLAPVQEPRRGFDPELAELIEAKRGGLNA